MAERPAEAWHGLAKPSRARLGPAAESGTHAMIIMSDLAAFTRHGGALDAARAMFPKAPEPWIDLSTGINPVAYPLGDIPAEAWTRLPGDGPLADLERAAADRYRAPPGSAVVAGPGTQAIIQRLPALCEGRDVRLLGRTYGEFERVFRDAGARVRQVPTVEALAGADVAVVVNPNNPDGRLLAPDDLVVLSRRVGMLVVDEAFMDALAPKASLVARLPASRVIALRSFGKIYGLPGLRLGFAVAPPDCAEALRRMLGPWPVGGPAIAVGTQALADEDWLAATRVRLQSEGARLMFLLGHIGAKLVGATPLFRLIAHPAAPSLFAALGVHGILTRPFSGEPTWLRFGLPRSEAEWGRMTVALQGFR